MLAHFTRAALAAALALGLAGAPLLPAFAADTFGAGDIRVETPWSRATPGAAPVAGGYLTIVNTGSEPDRLLGGSAEISERFEVHSMETVDGVARMAPVQGGLEIPPGGSVALAPGGYHVMLMGLKRPLAEGETFAGTLVFERAGEVPVVFSVGALGSRTPPMGHGAH
ncbi:copper chaperone PCu(A)C [Salinarimonas rosea]|uniref:copper chaperone PCu(A)C n=1 Tax=Salinarimonas rosea TaxID=552063 RepID=UPI0003F8AEB6|nr:copper chaperone PCu(A)C [Salinarimonas rosea]